MPSYGDVRPQRSQQLRRDTWELRFWVLRDCMLMGAGILLCGPNEMPFYLETKNTFSPGWKEFAFCKPSGNCRERERERKTSLVAGVSHSMGIECHPSLLWTRLSRNISNTHAACLLILGCSQSLFVYLGFALSLSLFVCFSPLSTHSISCSS